MILNNLCIAIIIVLTSINLTYAEDTVLKYNLYFGMKKKEAKKMLEGAGIGEIKEVSDSSKDIVNLIVFESLFNNALSVDDSSIESELEFYDNKLMATSLFLKASDVFVYSTLEKGYLAGLIEKYNKPSKYERVMGINSWIWLVENYKIILNSNRRKKKIQLSYMYVPILTKRYEDEVTIKLKGKPVNIAEEKFLK